MLRIARTLLCSLSLLGCVTTTARADQTIYSDLSNFSGVLFTPGAAAADGVTATSSSTRMAVDDITVAPGFGGVGVNSFTFTFGNYNSSTVDFIASLRIYGDDGAGGGPGTLLYSFDSGPLELPALTLAAATGSSTGSFFTTPQSGRFYVGEFFSNDNTSATADQLNNLGLGAYNPPTVGSSQPSFLLTPTGGSTNTTDNPAGTIRTDQGGNFGFAFTTPEPAVATPEPAGVARLLSLGLGLGGFAIASHRRRRRRRL